MYRKSLALLFFVSISGLSQADTQSPATAKNNTEPSMPGTFVMGLSFQQMGFAGIEDTPADMALDRTTLKVPFGKFEGLDQIIVPSLSLERMGFRFKDVNGQIDNQEVFTIKPTVTLISSFGEDSQWTRIISISPSLHSDLDTVDEDAFSLMGLAILKYQSSDHHGWTMGVGANRLFGHYKPIPLVSYAYTPSNDTTIDIGFPLTKIERRIYSNWTTFAGIGPMGGNWRIGADNGDNVNLSYTSWVATVGIRKHLFGKFWATIEGGQTFNRKLDIDTDNGVDDANIDDAHIAIFTIGLHP